MNWEIIEENAGLARSKLSEWVVQEEMQLYI